MLTTAEQMAKFFHETYERLAPSFGYETRKASAVPWEEVPEKKRQLMVEVCAVCREVLFRREYDVLRNENRSLLQELHEPESPEGQRYQSEVTRLKAVIEGWKQIAADILDGKLLLQEDGTELAKYRDPEAVR